MPIKVACQCGAAFAAKDELGGRTVACPKCKQPLKIPAPQAAAVAPQAGATSHANADLFDDLGLRARSTTASRCPSCDADLPPNAVLCVKCGYNLKLGKKMQTMNMAGDGSVPVAGGHGGGHGGNVTAMIMAKAAQNAEDDVQEEKKKTSEGMPIWVLVVGVVASVLFGVVMTLIDQSTALIGTGILLLVANFVLVIFAWVGICINAFIKKPLFGVFVVIGDSLILCGAIAAILWLSDEWAPTYIRYFALMLIGVCSTAYAYTDEDCAKYLFFSWLAYVMRSVALVLLVIGILVAAFNSDGSALPERPADSIAVAFIARREQRELGTPSVLPTLV